METSSIDFYVSAVIARYSVMRRPDQQKLDEPGVHGLLPSSDDPRIRLLVTDDRAWEVLAALVPEAGAGMISVFAAAGRCAELVAGHPAWRSERPVTAMICRDLWTVPELTLPSELTFRSVRRLADDSPEGVPLEDAVAAVMRADPAIDDPPVVFADYLRSLPSEIRLFAAVDSGGVVRATSGSGAFGTEASVMFVNTDPEWRGRGIGRMMTAEALRAAHQSGARRASLDATDPARRIYQGLGFEDVTRTTRFLHTS